MHLPALYNPVLALFFSLFLFPHSEVLGAELSPNPAGASTVKQVSNVDRTRVSVQPSYYRMTNDNGFILSGIEFDSGITIAANEITAFGARFGQAYSVGQTASALFTLIAVEMEYAITGSLVRHHSTTSLYGSSVYTNSSSGAKGFRGNIKINQYYINTQKSAVPLSGIGIGFFYEHPIWRHFHGKIGGEIDKITNGDFETTPMKIFAGVISVTN